MPPKKVQPKAEAKVEPKKQQPKVQEKKQPEKGQKGVKQEAKRDGKGSIQKTIAKNEKQELKGDSKKGQKKQNPKDAKNEKIEGKDVKKDTKVPDKKDNKDQKEIKDKQVKDAKGEKNDKKDANNKSITKLDKSQQQQKLKKEEKGQSLTKQIKTKEVANRHADKEKVEKSRAIINKMDEQPEHIQRVKGDDYLIKDTGLLQAYQIFLRTICKYGLPTGDIYEFAAQQIEKYQRKKKAKQLKIKAQMQIRKAASKRPPPKQEAKQEN